MRVTVFRRAGKRTEEGVLPLIMSPVSVTATSTERELVRSPSRVSWNSATSPSVSERDIAEMVTTGNGASSVDALATLDAAPVPALLMAETR